MQEVRISEFFFQRDVDLQMIFVSHYRVLNHLMFYLHREHARPREENWEDVSLSECSEGF